jgi:hypothetical protein
MVAQTQKNIIIMKDLLKCSLDELLTEKQIAINNGNLDRYRECNELISTIYNKSLK